MKKSSLIPTNCISVGGAYVQINWSLLRVGMSVFVPCVDTDKVIADVRKYTKKQKWRMVHVIRIENAIYGIRFWRIK